MTIHSKAEFARRQVRITDEAQAQQTAIHSRVGVYMIVWGSVESLLIGLLGHVLNTNKANAQIIYTGLQTVKSRRDTIVALIKRNVSEPEKTRLLTALKVFKSETSRRNSIAHSEFTTNNDGFYVAMNSYDLDDVELENPTVTTTPVDQEWFDGIETGIRHLSFLENEFGKINDLWLARQR